MNKLLIPLIIVSIIGFILVIRNGQRPFEETVLCKSVDVDGKPGEKFGKVDKSVGASSNSKYYVSPKDTTVYVSSKIKKFRVKRVKKVMIRWYKGEFSKSARIKEDNNVSVSKAGYVSSELTVPEGFKEGSYHVAIYNLNRSDGVELAEGGLDFEVKK